MPKLRDPLAPRPKITRKTIALSDPLWAEIDRIAAAKSARGERWSSAAVASALLEWAVERYGTTFMRDEDDPDDGEADERGGPGVDGSET